MIEELVMNLGVLMKEDLVTNVHLVHQDNMSTITLSTKGGGKPRTKYMRVHQEYIKEHTGTGELQIKYCKTKFGTGERDYAREGTEVERGRLG